METVEGGKLFRGGNYSRKYGGQFCVKNLKMKRKKDKTILTFQSGDWNPRFSVIFPPTMEGEGDEIKSRQGS